LTNFLVNKKVKIQYVSLNGSYQQGEMIVKL